MALVKCTECGSDVSDKAEACPKCGNPIGVGEIEVINAGNIPIQLYKNGDFCGKLQFKGDSKSISTATDFELSCQETANGGYGSLAISKGMNMKIEVKAKMIGGVKFTEAF